MPGKTYSVAPKRAHLVKNAGGSSAMFFVLQGIGEYDLFPAPKGVTESRCRWRELLPSARRFAVLVNIANAASARSLITGTQQAALTIGIQVEFVFASDEEEI